LCPDKNKTPLLKDLGEFGFIRSIQKGSLFNHHNVIKGIGDDCAVLGPYDHKAFLLSTDLLIEDIHFKLSKIPPQHLGQKAVAVNLSDIAAMGGIARHLLVALAVPNTLDVSTINAFYKGIKTICREFGVNIIGGDTSSSPAKMMINITVMGDAPEDEVLYRHGASHGDLIFVTGTLGNSAAGLQLILENYSVPQKTADVLIKAHHLPTPFLEIGRLIARSRLASAMIDLSDGLISDLDHICRASGVGASLNKNALPISDELQRFAKINHLDPYEISLMGGEDYRLLITVPRSNAWAFKQIISKEMDPIYQIGEITHGSKIEITGLNGRVIQLKGKGFDHFI